MSKVHQAEAGGKQNAELVQGVNEAVVSWVWVVNDVRGLEADEQ